MRHIILPRCARRHIYIHLNIYVAICWYQIPYPGISLAWITDMFILDLISLLWNFLPYLFSFLTHTNFTCVLSSDLQSCLICIACRIPRTQAFSTESFITRQDPTGKTYTDSQKSFDHWSSLECLGGGIHTKTQTLKQNRNIHCSSR